MIGARLSESLITVCALSTGEESTSADAATVAVSDDTTEPVNDVTEVSILLEVFFQLF